VNYTFVSVSESFRWCPACGPVLESMTMTFGEILELAAKAKQNRIVEATKIAQGVKYLGRIKNERRSAKLKNGHVKRVRRIEEFDD